MFLNEKKLRKINKLLRDPKLFFYDYLKKRIEVESERTQVFEAQIQSSNESKRDSLTENDTEDMTEVIEKLIEYLLSYTCFIQTMPMPDPTIKRILIKSTDIGWILKKINDFEYRGYRCFYNHFPITRDYSKIIQCYIVDDKYRYTFPIIELDPWHHAYGRIYTLNYNPYITHADEVDINKTVYSPNPYFLQGDIDIGNIDIIKTFNLPNSILHDISFPVDIVYTWVDGNDPEWIEKKNAFLPKYKGHNENIDSARFEQINELLYSLRSVEKYFKSYRKIFIVTDSQVPYWLDTTHPSIEIIDHKDIFENKEVLPVFNSHAIEANLHNIPGLSEHFIYMNDDVFFWKKTLKEDFFYSNGISKSRFENISNINAKISDNLPAWKSAALQSNKLLKDKYLASGYSYHQHSPHALNKEVLKLMWLEFKDKLAETSSSKFRSVNDVSPVSFLYHYFSFIKGKSIYVKSNTLTVNSGVNKHLNNLQEHIHSNKYDFVCINDGGDMRNEKKVIEILNSKFPISAKWELE